MSSNPYAPPIAEVADVHAVSKGEPAFFAVSLTKLTVLSLCTMGLYELYWFYKNWQLIRAREQTDILPFWRAFFAIFFCYGCFARIRDGGREVGLQSLAAGPLAAGWIVMTMLWKLPDPYWLVTYGAIFFMLPVQACANRINAAVAPGHDANSRFTAANWIIAVVGGLLFLMAIIGTFMPEE